MESKKRTIMPAQLSHSIFTFFMKKLNKKWLSLGLIGLSLFPYAVQAAVFTDVTESTPFSDAIQSLYDHNVTKGYSDGTFKPNQLITRAELIKMVFSHIGYSPSEAIGKTKYKDVPEDAWFAPYVKKAVDIGLLSYNNEDLNFLPTAPVSKIEALKIIMPLEGIPMPLIDTNTRIIFSDVRDEVPYAYIVKAAQNAGLYTPGDKRFNAFNPLTRGEFAYLLYRCQIYRDTFGTTMTTLPPDLEGEDGLSQNELQLIQNPKFPIFVDVWSRINDSYMNKNDVNQNDLIYSATQGMVDSLGDKYSIFESPEKGMETEKAFEGSYEGIGIVLNEFNKQPIVLSVLKDSPAEKAGLKAGDILVKIDGKSLEGLAIDEVSAMIKGKAGTIVKLEINRDGVSKTFTITREQLNLDTVTQAEGSPILIPENIGYVSIYQFTEATGDEFDTLLKETLAKNPEGLILDLRDDPGGYLSSAYQVMGHFIPKNDVMMNLKIGEEIIDQRSEGEGEIKAKKIPVIVMVNDGTASASEVVAGALQDYKIGKLLGVTTYGKGTVQEVTNYTDGSFFKLSIAHWLTPLKRDINKVGLKPDIEVTPTKDDALGKTDSQLSRAIIELQKMIDAAN